VVAVYGETYTHSSEKTNEIGPDGRYAYRPMMVERLKAKLRNDRVITRFLGKTEKLTADDPRTFRRKVEKYVDSTGAVDAATRSFWPVVRMVRGVSWPNPMTESTKGGPLRVARNTRITQMFGNCEIV
jgi:hypothetical protein